MAASADHEVKTKAQQVTLLQTEEVRLTQSLAAKKEQVRVLDVDLNAKLDKLQSAERTLQEMVGTKALSLVEAVRELETRQREATRTLREAGQQELALQAKISSLQEAVSRETQRVEKLKRDGTYAEEKTKMALADVEGRIAEFNRMEQEAITRAETARREISRLEPRHQELTAIDTQVRQLQEIDRRLRGQLEELEEKHETLRRGLASDEATVMMFANDLIKRIDLIDMLIQRYAGQNGGVDQQLRTLRAAFEDILHQHSVVEFDVPPNTEIDITLRQRIAVIESEPGEAKPRVVVSFRPGFVYAPTEGREVVLRKVEVKTSSR
jgi:DNA repair exonuclease SbcCD ATPase subunit